MECHGLARRDMPMSTTALMSAKGGGWATWIAIAPGSKYAICLDQPNEDVLTGNLAFL